ncbi:hypothetical protein CC80DRAFT_180337 [Byssothecium circinans]|uniref:Aminoglycoside phosphotransferase domain-containing protein n=1 Tax=Byssothecium circinans TaxID=147558 RepID=A0A6A5TT59_9PLEO|nr:hypothetical protein CC80DRAFT_180337 [Byssothecium circinans]
MSPNLQTNFWARVGLRDSDRDVCVRAIERVYKVSEVEEFGDQGYCSFTLMVTLPSSEHSLIVQLRPRQHDLDLNIAEEARKTYGNLAPRVRGLDVRLPGGLSAFEMELVDGVPLSKIKSTASTMDEEYWMKKVKLVESFASFIARAWPSPSNPAVSSRRIRADSLVFDGPGWLSPCTGVVGANIVPKLRQLARELPDRGLRLRAQETLESLLRITEYPVVLNHGDLIPSNILVDPETWEITGLVDWAEAEVLPFGTCLYGLEHLLGSIVDHYPSPSLIYASPTSRPKFVYHERAEELRRMFWGTLVGEAPELNRSLGEVRLMRDVGVLLWSGYAWDEGRIDRVVNEVDDGEEIACLRAFLGVA